MLHHISTHKLDLIGVVGNMNYPRRFTQTDLGTFLHEMRRILFCQPLIPPKTLCLLPSESDARAKTSKPDVSAAPRPIVALPACHNSKVGFKLHGSHGPTSFAGQLRKAVRLPLSENT